MRHNPAMPEPPERAAAAPRPQKRLRLLRPLLALAVLLTLGAAGAPGALAAKPTLETPQKQESVVDTPIAPLKIHGTEITSVKATGLPEGLTPVVPNASEVEITGTPAKTGLSKVVLVA